MSSTVWFTIWRGQPRKSVSAAIEAPPSTPRTDCSQWPTERECVNGSEASIARTGVLGGRRTGGGPPTSKLQTSS